MPINYREIIEAISELANNENVKVTVSKSLEGGLICAACSVLGGLLLGPRGLAIAGAVGSVLAYNMSNGSFRSLGAVIKNDLNDSQKRKLAQRVTNAVGRANISDLETFLKLINNNNMKETVLREIRNYVSNELSVDIVD